MDPNPNRPNGGDLSAPVPITQTAANLTDAWRSYLERQRQPQATIIDLVLPSGMMVRATRPHLLLLLRTGRIPDALAPRVEALIAQAQGGGESAVRAEMRHEQQDNPAEFYRQWQNLLDVVWVEAVVEPAFTIDPARDPDKIAASLVADEDKTYLFVWAQGVSESVADFRGRRAREAATLGDASGRDGVFAGPGGAAGDRPVE